MRSSSFSHRKNKPRERHAKQVKIGMKKRVPCEVRMNDDDRNWDDDEILFFLEKKGHNDTHDRRPQEGVEGTTTKIETMFLDLFFFGHEIPSREGSFFSDLKKLEKKKLSWKDSKRFEWPLTPLSLDVLLFSKEWKIRQSNAQWDEKTRAGGEKVDRIRSGWRTWMLKKKKKRRGGKLVSAWNSFTRVTLFSHTFLVCHGFNVILVTVVSGLHLLLSRLLSQTTGAETK